jgi:outer membrane lipoprotein carrier protein
MRPRHPFVLLQLLALTLFALTVAVYADDPPNPEDLARQLQSTYTDISSMSFSFSQTTAGPMTGRPKTGKGQGLYAKTPEKTLMRWNYASPDTQVVISDGETIWMYFEKLNQMIISPVDKAQTDILFSFFSAEAPLDRFFTILPPHLEMDLPADPSPELQILQLQPLDNNSQIRTIHTWIGTDDLIRRIELVDNFDTRTTINFSNIRIDPLDVNDRQDIEERFTFTPPGGTEIIRQ